MLYVYFTKIFRMLVVKDINDGRRIIFKKKF